MNGLECRGQPTLVPSARVRIPGWKREVERAMRELDPARLTACVYDAEWAIFVRMQKLSAVENPDAGIQSDLQSLRSGLRALLLTKMKRPIR